MMQYCSKCGAPNNDEAGFCQKCGNRLTGFQEGDMPARQSAPVPQQNFQQNAAQPVSQKQPKKKSKKGLIIGVVCGIVLLLLLMGTGGNADRGSGKDMAKQAKNLEDAYKNVLTNLSKGYIQMESDEVTVNTDYLINFILRIAGEEGNGYFGPVFYYMSDNTDESILFNTYKNAKISYQVKWDENDRFFVEMTVSNKNAAANLYSAMTYQESSVLKGQAVSTASNVLAGTWEGLTEGKGILGTIGGGILGLLKSTGKSLLNKGMEDVPGVYLGEYAAEIAEIYGQNLASAKINSAILRFYVAKNGRGNYVIADTVYIKNSKGEFAEYSGETALMALIYSILGMWE